MAICLNLILNSQIQDLLLLLLIVLGAAFTAPNLP